MNLANNKCEIAACLSSQFSLSISQKQQGKSISCGAESRLEANAYLQATSYLKTSLTALTFPRLKLNIYHMDCEVQDQNTSFQKEKME